MFGKVMRWGCATPILLLAIYGVWMLPGALLGLFVDFYDLPAPPASSYYDIAVQNKTQHDLMVTVCNLNASSLESVGKFRLRQVPERVE
jgi:hypothetical protein